MGAHEAKSESDEWYTPPEVFDALGLTFSLDVASPGRETVPWVPALTCITENSLEKHWHGNVWMNPPFGRRNGYLPWAEKFVEHGCGIALAPNRTAAPWFQWFASRVDGIFFWAPKIHFIRPDGSRGKSPGYGSVLLSIGDTQTSVLRRLHGKHGFMTSPNHTQGESK